MNKNYQIDDIWIKASIIGTIWAASEIVLGSFLHNLKIPFSSNILAGIGIVILISTSHIWQDKGLLWRSGLICALMKTMSPSAIIFGPMIAIFCQAMLLELSTKVFGKTIIGFILGAIFAMTWNLFQKIINFIILYGFNIVNIYKDLLNLAQKELNINFDIVWLPIVFLILVYSIFGFIASIVGIKVGQNIVKQPSTTKFITPNNYKSKPQNTQKFDYSIIWLILDVILIITSLLLLNFTSWAVWSIVILLTILTWKIRYKKEFQKLAKPQFWIYFVLITMATAFVISKVQSDNLINGMIAGIQMNFRAAVIILGFSVLGRELYNPKIKDFFMRTSFKQLPLALELSFQSLPMMIANIPEFKVIAKNPISVFSEMISQIESRLFEIKREQGKHVFIISGDIGEGKTTHIEKIVERLNAQNISVGGFISVRVVENGETIGYDIIDLSTKTRKIFLRKNGNENMENIGIFKIFPDGMNFGLDILDVSKNLKNKIVVIDEIGRFEIDDKVWAKSLDNLIKSQKNHLLIAVRDIFIKDVIAKWSIKNYSIFKVSDLNSSNIIDSILHLQDK